MVAVPTGYKIVTSCAAWHLLTSALRRMCPQASVPYIPCTCDITITHIPLVLVYMVVAGSLPQGVQRRYGHIIPLTSLVLIPWQSPCIYTTEY